MSSPAGEEATGHLCPYSSQNVPRFTVAAPHSTIKENSPFEHTSFSLGSHSLSWLRSGILAWRTQGSSLFIHDPSEAL